jgi:spore photoproduct lyase
MVVERIRKSKFVKLFDKTPSTVFCPHFYELILSNGCPYNCDYCYLKLTFRGKTEPNLFNNDWDNIKKELDEIKEGVFSTGELADSLAVIPPLINNAIDYFSKASKKYLLLVTKSTNVDILRDKEPNNHIILSFSVNASAVANELEKGAPSPSSRIKTANEMIMKGWRVRLRLDPIVIGNGFNFNDYKAICNDIAHIQPERVTIGTLRQYHTLHNFAPNAPKQGLMIGDDGRLRYSIEQRIKAYKKIKQWLGYQPALCKETKQLWNILGWEFNGCNCTE